MDSESTTYLAEHWRSLSQNRRRGPQSALFWDRRAEGYSRNISGQRRQKRTEEVFELIKTTGIELHGAEVLDIGCGPGTLALPLARMGAKVTAVDISAEMLKQLQKRAAEEDLALEKTVLSSWSDIDLDAQGFREKFDLVLASMTPGIDGPEAFEKMIAASKNVCYYSNFVARKWDPSYYELYRMLFSEKFGEGGYGFPLAFMYLYTLGYRPTIKLSKNTWSSDDTVDDMVETVSGFFSGHRDIDDETKGRMREYFQERAKDGLYHNTSDNITAMMVWRTSEE
ncbi:MAG: class I SAM-dependent methyltransferase [Methanotrichaceae archaeon]|nr:class I SAM-dependent methyltransferase [Methanotrichaceae archaeon]